MKRVAITLALVLVTGASLAQSHQPYAGLQSRAVKAFSDQQIADLRAGRGMSVALPAELNGYPGPLHVVEHASALALTSNQLDQVQRLYDQMKSEASTLGERMIAEEIELDRLFSSRRVTGDTLVRATTAIGKTQGELRATHLRYHLATVEVLTSDQLQRYAALRGYENEQGQSPHSKQHK